MAFIKCISCGKVFFEGQASSGKCPYCLEDIHKRTNKFVIGVSIFVCCCILSVVTAFIWISSNQNETNYISSQNETNYISSFNVSQGGEVAVCGNRLYFLIEDAIYESDLVFSTSKRILDLNTSNVLLCAGDEKLYYIQKEWNYENKKYVNTIFEYPVGASKASACGTFETTKEKEVELFLFVDDQFFMKVSDSIMCYKLQDSSLSTVIGNDVTTYTYDDGFLYIANSSGDILRYNLNSKLQETVYTIAKDGGFVWSDDYNQLFIKDDSLYFRELVGGEEDFGKPVSFNMKTKIYESPSESCSSHCVMDNTHYVIFQLDSTERSAFLNYYSGAIPITAAIELYSMTSGRLYSAKSDSSEYKLCNTPNRYYSKIYYTGKGLLLKDGLEISDQWSFFSVR